MIRKLLCFLALAGVGLGTIAYGQSSNSTAAPSPSTPPAASSQAALDPNVFYLKSRLSVTTSNGIDAYLPGTVLKKVGMDGSKLRVKAPDGKTFPVDPLVVTNDPKIAKALATLDHREQVKEKKALAAETATVAAKEEAVGDAVAAAVGSTPKPAYQPDMQNTLTGAALDKDPEVCGHAKAPKFIYPKKARRR